MIFKNGHNLFSKTAEFISSSESVFIFVPYIKIDTLKQLINNQKNIKTVFVRWELKDLVLGSSDLEIYTYLKSKDIALFRNPRIHLKAYVDNYRKCLLTTANISSRALNIPAFKNYNYEMGTIVEEMSLEDRLYFKLIENESTLITDSVYNQIKNQLPSKIEEFSIEKDFSLKNNNQDKDFLLSALPMSFDINTLIKVYESGSATSDLDVNCALHDLALYNISLGLKRSDFLNELKEAFFSHSFIKRFLENIEISGEIFFGRAKEWIHSNCTDVPLPRKWEINTNIQILYRWIVELGDGKFAVDRPNYSERLYLKIS